MADVFVSYARSDKARVAPLVAALEAQGWSVWWDPAITPGQEFDRLIAEQLAAASVVLVVWTPASVESRWVRGEARDGADRGILVPVRIGGAQLPIDFRAVHTIDLEDGEGAARSPAFREAIRAVGTLLARGDSTQPAAVAPEVTARAPITAPGTARAAICVLPFSNLGTDAEQQLFADGLAADVITELSRWRLLAVRPRSASFRYRGCSVDIAQVARELDVRYVVTGSVRRIGDRLRTSVELIDAETGRQVWAERFDRAQAELAADQDAMVQQVVSTLVGRLQVADAERARRKPTANLDAYECVLKGNALPWDDPGGAAEATRLFAKAIELDPGYGMAHGMLAMMRCSQWRNDLDCPDAVLEEAYALAKRAVLLDDGDSTCHSLLGQICMYRRSFELALQHMRRSVEMNPNNQWNLADLGQVLAYLGQPEEAIGWFKRAREIDPYLNPPWYWRQSGQTWMVLRRYEEALSTFAHIPVRTFRIAAYVAACHARLGEAAQARATAEECLALCPGFTIRRFMTREPFRHAADAEHLAESLRLAGLPDDVAGDPAWVDEVLGFWFRELGEPGWFARDDDVDQRIRSRFLALYQHLAAAGAAGPVGDATGAEACGDPSARHLLASVLVLDQFPRNMFRDSPRAFASDPVARRLARQAVARGLDRTLAEAERLFLYLPFEHSEDRSDQALAVELIAQLGNEGWTRYAEAHRRIIDRFGRFPHRNATLGRPSSEEELAFLQEPMSSF